MIAVEIVDNLDSGVIGHLLQFTKKYSVLEVKQFILTGSFSQISVLAPSCLITNVRSRESTEHSIIGSNFLELWKTRMHSSRMRTSRRSGRPGGSPPVTAPSSMASPRRRQPPLEQRIPPRTGYPPGAGTPPGGDTPLLTEWQTSCENITLPQLRCGR